MTDSSRLREHIKYQLSLVGTAIMSPQFFADAFPEPKRPTVEEMETAILSLVASPMVEDRSKIAHVFQDSKEEQIKKFCEENSCKIDRDYPHNTYVFFRKEKYENN